MCNVHEVVWKHSQVRWESQLVLMKKFPGKSSGEKMLNIGTHLQELLRNINYLFFVLFRQ